VSFEIGKAIPMRKGNDALIVTTGITLRIALDAASTLSQQGLEAAVLHVPTIKPLDKDTILDYAARVAIIVTVEEHTVIGGLGSAVAEVLAEARFDKPKQFKRLGLPDVFPGEYGSQGSLMARYGITSDNIAATVEELTSA